MKMIVINIFTIVQNLVVNWSKFNTRCINKINEWIEKTLTQAFQTLVIKRAVYWQHYYRYKNWLLSKYFGHKVVVGVFVLTALAMVSWHYLPNVNMVIGPYFSDNTRFSNFQTLLITLGSALIGATAIAFSLIMFAMQVNVERMPHGLFKKFSSDSKLLGSFGVTFSLAITITLLSLLPDKTWVAFALVIAVWCVVLIFILLLFAYRRALSLISPTTQLFILLIDTKKNFKIWERAAIRTAPILKNSEPVNESDRNSSHDMERIAYFQFQPNWTVMAKKSVMHCISFSRRYAEQGDHEVSESSLNALVAIHSAYIDVKGKTFFINNPFFENPLSSDAFITDTLEHLRQNVQIGISRGDEQQIEQSLRTFEQLCLLFLTIDYSTIESTKTHANLAAAYLTGAVESIAPLNMTDVIMEGTRVMGNVAQAIINHGDISDVTTISKKIALISCVGVVNQKHLPVTQIGVEKLSQLTFSLLRNDDNDVRFALQGVRGDVKLIATMLINTQETGFVSVHGSNLAPYYSSTNAESLLYKLEALVNVVLRADEGDENANNIVRHLKQWSDDIYQVEKELLLLAIEKRSGFTFDIIHWIVNITKLLLAVSNANACEPHYREELISNATWLISTLSWIPDDQETVQFVENYQLAEQLFESVLDANNRDYFDVAIKIRNLLLSWAFKAGKYQTGCGTLERACYGLACLNIILDINDDVLFNMITERVTKEDAPSFELRSRVSNDIRDTASAYHSGHGSRSIDRAMANVDQDRLRVLLIGVANHLIPEVPVQEEQEGDD